MDVTIDPAPNPGIAAALMSGEAKRACLLFAMRAAQLYRQRVHKDTHELELSTKADTAILRTRYGPRYVGEVTVDSPHFLPHEEGWTEDGEHHEGAHDFNAVLNEMAGLPSSFDLQSVGRAQQAIDRGRAGEREINTHRNRRGRRQ